MSVMVVAIAGIVGVLLGPWLRGVIFTHSCPVGSPSQRCCPTCGAELLPQRLPLVSRLPCSGGCPACWVRIGPRNGVVEIITGAVLAGLAVRVTPLPLLVGLCWLAACGVALATIDVHSQRLPNILVGSALIGLFSALTVTALAEHQLIDLVRAILGGLILLVGYTALAMLSGGLGFGDCKLGAVLGTALGWFGWTTLLIGTWLAFLLAALYLLAQPRPGNTSARPAHVPFGPALLLGTLTAILVAP